MLDTIQVCLLGMPAGLAVMKDQHKTRNANENDPQVLEIVLGSHRDILLSWFHPQTQIWATNRINLPLGHLTQEERREQEECRKCVDMNPGEAGGKVQAGCLIDRDKSASASIRKEMLSFSLSHLLSIYIVFSVKKETVLC